MNWLADRTEEIWQAGITHLSSPAPYVQILVVVASLFLAWRIAGFLRARVKIFRQQPEPGTLFDVRNRLHGARVPGIDDGDSRVGADLLLMIWTALRTNGITIPFPQREVTVRGQVQTS